MASEEYTESEISKIVKRLMDEEGFEFGEAVKEAMEQTKKFESKADGGSIGIEILFGPKRGEYQTGGPAYDSRATAQDYANALKSVSAGTTYQQQADAKRYARNQANQILTNTMRSGNQANIQNLLQQVGGITSIPGMQFNRSGNRITTIPATGPGRDKILNALANQMLSTTSYGGGSSAPMKKSPLQLKIEENQRLFNEYVKNNPPLTGIITGPKGGTPTSPGLPPYLDKNLLSQLTMLTPEEAFAGETFDTLSDLDQYNFAQAFTQFKPQLRDPTYVSPYGIDDQQIFSRRYGIKDGGRVPALSGGLMKLLAESAAKGKKGIMELVETGKGKFDEFVETQTSKKPSDSFTPQNITADLIDGPITVEKMANLDSKTLNIIKNTYDQGLYKEMPEILKAGNLLERFTKVVKGERIIDYERAEAILGVSLKGDETLNDLFKIEFNTRPVETMADGGRVGLFMGGPPLEGQALSIYDSMNKYGFSDQEIADALNARGLYTAPGSSTPETTAPNIINQQLQTGGGGDNNFGGPGIGAFGNLDPNTLETMQVEVADGMGGTKIKEVDTYLTAGGLRRTLDNKNPVNLGLDIKPMAITIMEALMGKKTDSEFDPAGKIYGTFNNPNYKDLSFFGKIKADYSRQKELKQLQEEFEKQEKLKEQIRQEAIANANKPYSGPTFYNSGNVNTDGGTGGAISQDFKNTTASIDNYSADVLRAKGGMVGYKDGGLATMFTRRR